MHYIRLLRPAKLDGRKPIVSLLITITTDLGDSFLYPDEPVDLLVSADDPVGQSVLQKAAQHQPLRWTAGMRVLDIKVPLNARLKRDDVRCTIKIHPATQPLPLGALRSNDVLPWRISERSSVSQGLIMPVSVEMVGGVCSPVALRTLQLNTCSQPEDQLNLDLEEDIGESIARHIWDAGVVTASFLADACRTSDGIRAVLPMERGAFSVLELGSGVGILGVTLALIIQKAATVQGRTLNEATVLLTDLAEAEERARSNISRSDAVLSRSHTFSSTVTLEYENLDWDEGKLGRFGSLASARPWDLVILSDCTYNVDSLPALVGTLSALHTANLKYAEDQAFTKTSVILATKPRHSSEQALFGLLKADDWRYSVLKSIPLPRLGEDDEVVDIYLLEKGDGNT
ncbi:putative methyltransferase-domain-containing protein [Annulohypoxylon maeteangense]|uniref:putative methyltransferase-domain-containing protein n=1 Tax=Annulohypoxylon maeteangense TaxID=1927788 RepID=UPI00200725F1|nr:putative methyltransferase-domain-containing protein [Annulohypoxylon maeteangense]KAI0886725.1 putative methyltransferase-domain-containing protein [Annulohypoxylon maeteangense]